MPRHRPAFVPASKLGSTRHDRGVAVDAHVYAIAVGALKENLISMNGSDGFRFAPHDSEWIGQEVDRKSTRLNSSHIL